MTSTTSNKSNRMARTLATTLVVGVCIGLALGWALFGQRSPEPPVPPARPPDVTSPEPSPAPAVQEPDEEEAILPASPPPLAARQLFIYLIGTELDKRTAASLREFCPGGVVLRDENIASSAQARDLIRAIQRTTGEERRPAIALDASPEGYRRLGLDMVMRFEDLGLLDNPDAVREAGRRRGDAARAIGAEVILAPPLDVFVPGLSPDELRAKCFSEDAARVSELGLAFAEGVKDSGAIPVATHFPGLGLVEHDDAGRSVILVSDKNDLADLISPFRNAVAAKIPGMVVTHAEMVALDAGIPASQSHVLLETLVRQKWGFDGVIVAQGILTHPMTSGLAPEEVTVLALSAGCDAVIVESADRRILHRICGALSLPENEALLPETSRAASRARLDAWRLAPLKDAPEETVASSVPEPTPVPAAPVQPLEETVEETPDPVVEETPPMVAPTETTIEEALDEEPPVLPVPAEEEEKPETTPPAPTPEPVADTPASAPAEQEGGTPVEAPLEPEPGIPPPGTELRYHSIEQGESLLGIAGQYGVQASDIKRWNDMADDTIKYGYGLKIYLPLAQEPEAEGAMSEPLVEPEGIAEPVPPAVPEPPEPDAEPVEPATVADEATPEPPPEEDYGTYRVVGGDRLNTIAAKYGTTAERLMEINKIDDPNHVWVGQKLKIPVPKVASEDQGIEEEEQ